MKTRNKKYQLLCVLLFIAVSSCKDTTLETDITQFEWQLKFIKKNGTTYKPGSYEAERREYLLWFYTDSTFMLNTSVNEAGGKFTIPQRGSINVSFYQSLTQVCCEKNFDEILLAVFPQVTSYSVKGNALTFKGGGNEVEFKKK